MNLKIKKIIAREGLILIAIGLLAGVYIYLPHTYVHFNKDMPIDLLQQKRLKITDTSNGTMYTIIIDDPYEDDHINDVPDRLEKELIALGKKGQLETVDNLNIVRKESPLVIKNYLLYFIIGFYPIYFTLRFVAWAINTLSSKES